MTFDDIYNFIVPNNFGVSLYAGDILISNGVKYALEQKAITPEEITNAINRFESGDFGDAYTFGETPIKGQEYGEYKTDLTPGNERGYLWLHRENANIVVYFHFER
jgi:hypothetical protein